MRAINLKTNHLTAPVGIDAGPLFLSWQCADGVRSSGEGKSGLWNRSFSRQAKENRFEERQDGRRRHAR